jgi:hypothetical protein
MPQVATASDFPVPNDFMQPIGMLACWSAEHRSAKRVRRDAIAFMSQLDFIANLRLEITIEAAGGEHVPGSTQADRDEEMLELLQSMRAMHAELAGVRVRKLRRDVDHFAPDLRKILPKSIEAASKKIAEMRATLAFLTGESDDAELGIEIVPNAGEPLPPMDSAAARDR